MASSLSSPLQSAQAQDSSTSLSNIVDTKSKHWKMARIVEERWDQLFPFQLIILEHQGDQVYEALNRYTLPIPPQALTITTPFAISTTITPGGVVEEHNADPIRIISLQGTTGVLPARQGGEPLPSPSLAASIFAGTIQAANNLRASAEALAKSYTGFTQAIVTESDILGSLKGTTGYYQFLLLQRFLEEYVRAKKNGGASAKKLRLGFAHWKMGYVYLVTPEVFAVSQTAGKPLQYDYTLQLKAWGRTTLNESAQAISPVTTLATDPGKLQQALQSINQARTILNRSKDLIRAVGQDVLTTVFEPLRQALFFLKDAAQVPLAVSDLSDDLVAELQSTIVAAYGAKAAIDGTGKALSAIPSRLDLKFSQIGQELASTSTRVDGMHAAPGASTPGMVPVVVPGSFQTPGRPPPPLSPDFPDRSSEIFRHPQRYPDFLGAIQVQALDMPPRVRNRIDQERRRIRNLRRADFESQRDAVVHLASQFEQQVGAGHPSVSRLRGLQGTPLPQRTPTSGEYEAMGALNQLAMELGRLAVSRSSVGSQERLTRQQYLVGLAQRSGINLQVPNSQFLIPFPYGSTLERLALRHLGDPDRWMEIANLNGLREPFVDEVGFTLPLLARGEGHQVVVGNKENLYPGQSVWLQSATTSRSKRTIIGMAEPTPGNVYLTLDGDADLDRFDQTATLKAYLPGTVNSLQLIAIPSAAVPFTEDLRLKPIPGLDPLDVYIRLGGVDLAITASGDAAILEDGDWRLSVGLANLVQKLKVWVGTPRNSQLRHPGFGNPIQVGDMASDASPEEVLDALQSLTKFEPAFQAIEAASVRRRGPTTQVQATIRLKNTEMRLPVTFDLNK